MKFRVLKIEGAGAVYIIADEEVIGLVEVDEERGIRLEVPRSLGEGRLVGEEEARRLLQLGEVLALYGDKIIGIALRLGLVAPSSILRIGRISHVYVLKSSPEYWA